MNPRHRRMLIPGLLVALVVVAAIATAMGKADAAERVEPPAKAVSLIEDPRIDEASGMAVSREHDDLAYVVNDSGNDPVVFAVQISTGDVVGTTTVTGVQWRDTEALALDADGTLWVADTGDNLVQRDDVALYALPEPGPGEHRSEATRYPVTFPAGPQDVEALLIDPRDRTTYLVSKGLVAGEFYRLPAELREDAPNSANRVEGRAPGAVTDGAFTSDGERVLLRTYGNVQEYASADLSSRRVIVVPDQKQGETLAIEPGDRSFLIGSEGSPSPLVRVQLDGGPDATTDDADTALPEDSASGANVETVAVSTESASVWWWAGGAVVALVALGAVVRTRRR